MKKLMGKLERKDKETKDADKKKEIKERLKDIKILPESNKMSVAILACGFAEVFFLMFVLALDVLPFKYIIAVIVALLIIDAVILLLVNSKTRRATKHIGALVIIVFMLNLLLMSDYYVYSTYDTLQKISKEKATWEYYNVIALKDGSYNQINDIRGDTVYVANMQSKQLNEARERLITKEDVTYNEEPDFMSVGQKLYNDKGEKNDNIILVSETNYKLLKENIKGYAGNTKTIYKIKVKRRVNDNADRVDVTTDSFNILITGVDVWGGIHKEGLSDVNMVMTVNPRTKQVLLTSIPRDSWVTLASYGGKDKLTHTGIYGAEETEKTIENFLDIKINYTMRVNFAAVVDLVNAVGGIDVYSDYEFKSAISHWTYTKGWNSLTGHSALYFARERKAFSDGDMQRNRQQQIVLEALIKKITNSKVVLTSYTKILDAVGNDITTDLSDRDMKKLVKMQLKSMPKWEIKKYGINGATGSAPCYSMGGRELSCVFPSDESVEEAKKQIHDVMYPVVNQKTKKTNSEKETNSSSSGSEGDL